MLGAILDLEKLEVGEVMTHRRNIVSINADAPVEEIVRQVLERPLHPLPDLARRPGHDHRRPARQGRAGAGPAARAKLTGADLRRLAAPPWFIPDTTSLLHQLLAFRQRRAHLAFVVDEYGALMGLVTLEDILEEIVGDIVDEKDVEMSGVQAGGRRQHPGRGPGHDPRPEPPVRLEPARRRGDDGGRPACSTRRAASPRSGESFLFHGFRFEVLRRQRHQLTLLRLRAEAGLGNAA